MHVVRFVMLAAIAAPFLTAQTTTWASFARRGLTMAWTPVGGVVMFGGSSTATGQVLRDTARLTGNGWIPGAAGPLLSDHAMAATMIAGQPAYVVFGGRNAAGVPTNQTWKYDGTTWGGLPGLSLQRPTPRTGHAMVTNTATQTILLFGGFDGTLSLNDVWELNPSTGQWNPHVAVGGPAPRFDHTLAFHPVNGGGSSGRLVLFGGTPFQNDLWEFDPFTDTWTNRTPAVSPPGRRKAAMAYVANTDTIVLFGGQGTGLATRNDTWEYDRWTNTWTQQAPVTIPPARFDHAVSPESTGTKLVMFGGANAAGDALESTWFWNGVDWIEQLPSPSPRDGAAMAFDGARNRHVVFGGRAVASGADLDETWELEGVNWRRRFPSTKPPPRSDTGMAFDKTRNRTMLYGGRSQAGGDLADTWEWNGTTWTLRSPSIAPPAAGGTQPVFDSRRNRTWMVVGSDMWSYDGDWRLENLPGPRSRMGSAHDAGRDRIVVFGGLRPGGPPSGETWEWDGGRWIAVNASPTPAARSGHGMAFDAARQQVVITGGASATSVLGDTWRWNGTAWTAAASLQPALAGIAMAGATNRSRVVVFGGSTAPGAMVASTIEWDGLGWTTVPLVPSPPPRGDAAMAYDPTRGRITLFGGNQGTTVHGDTWEYDGLAWVQRLPTNSPPPSTVGSMAFDPRTGRLMLFGGFGVLGVAQPHNETWLWDGTDWQQAPVLAVRRPPARYGAMLVGTGTRTILWSGAPAFADMWEWTGADWVLIDSGAPPARTNYGAAYDARADRVVVFGGMTANNRALATYNNETWEWDGDSWLQRFPANAPSPRGWCKLAYDEARSRVVLFGGADAASVFQDTWEWNGTDWLLQNSVASPQGSFGHDLAFDQARKLTIAFGSRGVANYGPVVAASITPFGAGCPTSASVPASAPLAIKALPWSGPWLGERLELDFEHRPFGLGIFLWGLSNTMSAFGALPFNLAMFGSPNCSMRVSADVTELIFPGTTRYVSFVLPNHPLFLGAVMYGQAGFFDAGLPGVPVVTSNGIEMVFGQK